MFSKFIVASLLTISTVTAFAQVDARTANARSNDVASKYTLASNGTFSRIVNGRKCDITTNVSSFKVSQHQNDVAMAYFEKQGDLFIIKNARGDFSQCPKADKTKIVTGVKKYSVVSNASAGTLIVNLTLDNAGNLKGWDNTRAVVSAYNIKTYVNNECFGARGKSFSSYAAFALTYQGMVVKIKGGEVERKVDTNRYYDLQDFKARNRVCQ